MFVGDYTFSKRKEILGRMKYTYISLALANPGCPERGVWSKLLLDVCAKDKKMNNSPHVCETRKPANARYCKRFSFNTVDESKFPGTDLDNIVMIRE